MLKKETINKIAKIENNPFIIHILNKQNLNVKDLLMIMSLCGNKFNAEKIKNLVLSEINNEKEIEKPKKVAISKPFVETIEPEVIEPEVIEPETVETELIKPEEVIAEEPKEEVIESIEENPVEEPEKPKKKGGKKKKAVATEETSVEEPKTEE